MKILKIIFIQINKKLEIPKPEYPNLICFPE